jgi:hypothetical protein
VKSNAGGSGSVATLSGTATPATAPALTLDKKFFSFASQKAGTASTMQAINLTNSGTAPLSLSSIAVVAEEGQQDDFKLRNDCVPVLAPGRHCTLFVTFVPVAAGSFFATLVINDNAQVSQEMVEMSGLGL